MHSEDQLRQQLWERRGGGIQQVRSERQEMRLGFRLGWCFMMFLVDMAMFGISNVLVVLFS